MDKDINRYFKRAERLEIPVRRHIKTERLRYLINKCSIAEPETMTDIGDFFSADGDDEFCEAAANFWYGRAALYGSIRAKCIILRKYNKKREPLIAAAMPLIGNEKGERLRALGFTYFSKKYTYIVHEPDENGIIEASKVRYKDKTGVSDFGWEEYDNWCFLDENLKEIPYTSCICLGDRNADEKITYKMQKYNSAVACIARRRKIEESLKSLSERFLSEKDD